MYSSTADIKSADPQRILKMLCNHWRHRFEIRRDHDNHALIDLGERGLVEFSIAGMTLTSVARHPVADSLPTLKTAIENHLQRFARDETLAFPWLDS